LEVISKASQHMRNELRASRHEALTVAQFRVLMNLRCQPNSTTKDLADVIGVSVPSMSRMLHSLGRNGYVVREADTVDRRKSWIEVTTKGQQHLTRGCELAQSTINEKLNALDAKKRDQLKAGLLVLREVCGCEPA